MSASPSKRPRDGQQMSSPNKKSKFRPLSTELPADLSEIIEPKEIGTARFVSLNINSVSPNGGAVKPDLLRYAKAEDADILCLQETKTAPENLLSDLYKFRYFSRVKDKAKHGVATLSKHKPISVHDHDDLNTKDEFDFQGRFLSLEFATFYVVNVYAPMAGAKLERLTEKLAFNKALEDFLDRIVRPTNKKAILLGDFNCALQEMDAHRAAGMFSGEAAKSQAEKTALLKIMKPEKSEKLIDIWRETHQDVKFIFTYYHPTFRSRGIGMRLDLILISESLLPLVKRAHLRRKIYSPTLSDHCPVTLDINIKFSTASD